MYTDTKNLANDQQCQLSSGHDPHMLTTRAPIDDKSSKRKLCKMWRPLLRLLARKRQSIAAHNIAGNNNTSSNSSSSSVHIHPNNVHLNNAQATVNTHKQLMESTEWPAALLEDYACVMRKVSCKEECNHAPSPLATTTTHTTHTTATTVQSTAAVGVGAAAPVHSAQPCQASAKYATTVISSASIEKTPLSTCAHCIYGRNCQHEQYHHHVCDVATATTTTTMPTSTTAADELLPAVTLQALTELPLHYVHTDDGTFFWTGAQERIDDDLLTAWLCHSLRQLPVQAALQV